MTWVASLASLRSASLARSATHEDGRRRTERKTILRVGVLVLAGSVALAAGGGESGCVPPGDDVRYADGRAGLMVRPFEVIADSTIAPGPLAAACAQWNEGLDVPLFDPCVVLEDRFHELDDARPALGAANEEWDAYDALRGGTVLLWAEGMGPGACEGAPDEEAWGCTEAHVSGATRETIWADTRVEANVSYHAGTVQAIIAHELAQVIGLAYSHELGSCMYDPVPVPCTVPESARRLAAGLED